MKTRGFGGASLRGLRALSLVSVAVASGCAVPSTRTGDPSLWDLGGEGATDLSVADLGPRDLAYADFRPQADFARTDFAGTTQDLAGVTQDLAGITQDLSATPPDLVVGPPDLVTPRDLTPPPDLATVVVGVTGDGCGSSAQCPGGTGGAGVCASTVDSATAPGGYCTSPCDPANTNPLTGKNTDCPTGTLCDSGGNECRKKCSRTTDCRSGYSCFNLSAGGACLPTSLSQCDPTKAGSCGAGKTCVAVGDGVGGCFPSCDPMQLNQCKKGIFPPYPVCHASPQTGEGACVTGSFIPPPFCTNSYSDCGDAKGCFDPGLNGVCYRYCNDANVATVCGAGATCTQMPGSSIPTSKVGICSM